MTEDVDIFPADIAAAHELMLARAGGAWFDFEQLVREVYRVVVKPNDRVLDVGANHGGHTLQVAPCVAPKGHVYAIEASADIADDLRRRISVEGRHLAHLITVINAGAYDRAGAAPFYSVPSHDGLSSLQDRPNVGFEKSVSSTDLVRLDDVVPSKGNPITFIKMDIEGAELFAMRGAARLIEKFKPVIVFEFDVISAKSFGYDAGDMLKFLDGFGYETHDFFGNFMRSKADYEVSGIWNYVAFSGQPSLRDRVLLRLRRYIEEEFKVKVPTVSP